MFQKKLFRYFLLTLVLAAALFTASFAEGEVCRIDTEEVYINPLYSSVLTESDLLAPESAIEGKESETAETFLADSAVYYDTMEKAAAAVYSEIENHDSVITMYYKSKTQYYTGMAKDLFHAAYVHTGVPTQGDYIRWQYGGFQTDGITYYVSGGYYYFKVVYCVTWYTSSSQEASLTKKLNSLLPTLIEDGMCDTEKLEAIYDYICSNVTYDYDHLEDESYKLQYTAYGALINGTAVCQGYVMLFYRMALMAGLDCRAVTSTQMGHTWNIAESGGKWYLLDATWDTGREEESWAYFLKDQASFSHNTADEYLEDASFAAAYPLAKSSASYGSYEVSAEKATCTEAGNLAGVRCYACGRNISGGTELAALGHNWGKGTVVIEADYTTIGERDYTCSRCGEWKSEEIPALTGMAKIDGVWGYYSGGQRDDSYTGMAKNQWGWWYFQKGQINFSYTGIAKNDYGSWYFKNGQIAFSYTGTVTINKVKYNIVKGQVK